MTWERWTDADFADPVNAAAKWLPEGWIVRIEVELHGGAVTLENPDGDEVDFPANHECWMEEVLDAVEHAMEQHKETTCES